MKIAMLLPGSIEHDHRVVKMINTLCSEHQVDLFCISDGQNRIPTYLTNQANVFFFHHPINLKVQVLRHSFFCFEFNHFIKKIVSRKVNYDIIWANDLPMLYPAQRLAKKLKAKVVYDSHEIYIETLNQFFPSENTFLKKIIIQSALKFMSFHGEMVERKWIKNSTLITVNTSLLDYFKEKYSISSGTVVMNLPNLVVDHSETINYRELFSYHKSDFILLYQGGFNQGRGLMLLIQVMENLPAHFKLIFIGDGPLKKEMMAKIQFLKLEDRIQLIPMVPIDVLKQYTRGADVGINLLENLNLSKKLASPNKLFEYIHAELPVLASSGYENQKIIDQFRVGITAEMNTMSIVQSIKNFNKNNLAEFKQNCAKAKSNLNWQSQAGKITGLAVLKNH